MSKQNSILFFGFLITLFISLSIHIVLLQVIGVGFPDHSPVPKIPKLLNTWFSVLALYIVHTSRFLYKKWPLIIASILATALYMSALQPLMSAVFSPEIVTYSHLASDGIYHMPSG